MYGVWSNCQPTTTHHSLSSYDNIINKNVSVQLVMWKKNTEFFTAILKVTEYLGTTSTKDALRCCVHANV